MTTAVAIGVVLIFALAGYFKGLVPACLDLASALASVVLLLLFVRPLAAFLMGRVVGSMPLAYVVAGVGIFLSVTVVAKLVGHVLRPVAKDEKGKPRFRGAGAAVNTMAGSVWAALLVWAIMLVKGVAIEEAPESRPFVEVVSGQAIAFVGKTVMQVAYPQEPLAGAATYQALKDPGRGAKGARAVLRSQKLKETFADPEFMEALQERERAKVLSHPKFRELMDDPEFAKGLSDLGFAATPEIAGMARERMADSMILLYMRAEALQSNPSVQATLDDPAFQKAVESGDIPALLRHPGLHEILVTLLAESTKPAPASTPAKIPAP